MSFTCPLCGGALHSMNEHGIWYKECVECSIALEFPGYQWVEIGTNETTEGYECSYCHKPIEKGEENQGCYNAITDDYYEYLCEQCFNELDLCDADDEGDDLM
jgi:hypothetical protein